MTEIGEAWLSEDYVQVNGSQVCSCIEVLRLGPAVVALAALAAYIRIETEQLPADPAVVS